MGAVLLTRLKQVLCLFRGTETSLLVKSLKSCWKVDKGTFVQLILNPAECVGQLLTRMKLIEIYEWVFCFWGRGKNLRKKGTSRVDNQ